MNTIDARRLASEPLPHVAGGVSARQITGKNAGSDAHTEAHEGVSPQTGAGFNHSAPIFAGAHCDDLAAEINRLIDERKLQCSLS